VFKNLNPATDIYFSQGPMDVLDHSCSKMGFGGKMCIDGTGKYEEESDEDFRWQIADFRLDEKSFQKNSRRYIPSTVPYWKKKYRC
jgi:4-hydroxy-3-polyprenylbenzoate decarboxylase